MIESAPRDPYLSDRSESDLSLSLEAQKNSTETAVDATWRSVLIIVTVVFLGEVLVMVALTWTGVTHPIFGLLDALLVATLSFVLLQHFVVRPMAQSKDRLQVEIAEHRRTANDLRLQTAAVQATAHGMMITDRTGSILWVNPAFVALTGYNTDDVLGKTPGILNSGQHDAAFYEDMWQTALSGGVWRGEIVNRRKDGTLYTEEQTITPVHNDAGKITHFIAVMADCTERKQTAIQLAQRNQQLLKLSQEEHRQRQLAESLARAAQSLCTSLEQDDVLDRILDEAHAMVPCRVVVIMLLRGEWLDIVRHRDVTGAPNAFVDGFSIDHFPGLRAMRTRRVPHLVADTQVEPSWADIPGLAWIRSYAMAPLTEGNSVLGFLAFVSEQPAFFDHESDGTSLIAFAAQAATALQNARLYQAERVARHTAEILSLASLDLTRTLQLQDVLDSLLRHLRQLVAYEGAHIALFTGQTYLTIEATAGDDPWATPEPIQPVDTIDVADCAVLQVILAEQQSLVLSLPLPANDSPYFAALVSFKSWLGVPIVVGNQVVGLCVLEHSKPDFFNAEHVRLTEVMVSQASVAIQNASLFQQVESSGDQLQRLSRRLVQVQENERKAVARELHDQAGQVLTSLKIGLRQLNHVAGQPSELKTSIAELCNTADLVLDDLHRLAMNLRPATLDYLGLVAAITDHVANLIQQHDLQIRFEAIGFDDQERLSSDIETALFRIAQEALTNVVRHASASRVDLLLHLYPDAVRLTVEDDGVGFDSAIPTQLNQLGLLGMRERCEMLGGMLEVESTPDQGTTLVAELSRETWIAC